VLTSEIVHCAANQKCANAGAAKSREREEFATKARTRREPWHVTVRFSRVAVADPLLNIKKKQREIEESTSIAEESRRQQIERQARDAALSSISF
jgi:hypothetical protein